MSLLPWNSGKKAKTSTATPDDRITERSDETGMLLIDGVNLSLLDRQRLRLASLMMRLDGRRAQKIKLSASEIAALDGILNMLDDWSDRRYFLKNGISPQKILGLKKGRGKPS